MSERDDRCDSGGHYGCSCFGCAGCEQRDERVRVLEDAIRRIGAAMHWGLVNAIIEEVTGDHGTTCARNMGANVCSCRDGAPDAMHAGDCRGPCCSLAERRRQDGDIQRNPGAGA